MDDAQAGHGHSLRSAPALADGWDRRRPPSRAAGLPRAWRIPSAAQRSGDPRVPAERRIRVAGRISPSCVGYPGFQARIPRPRHHPVPTSRRDPQVRASHRPVRPGRPIRVLGGSLTPGRHRLSGGLRLTHDLRVSARGGSAGPGPGDCSHGAAPPDRRRAPDGALRATRRWSRDSPCVGMDSSPALGASRRDAVSRPSAVRRIDTLGRSNHGVSVDGRKRHDVRDEPSRPRSRVVSLVGAADALTASAPRRIVARGV
jgi:hypothetical protein